MQAVAKASADIAVQGRNCAVTVIVARRRIVEDACGHDLAAEGVKLDHFVSVVCFSAVSIVHM